MFIPKPGKDSYDSANAFRPISLTSFVMKTMEKILDRNIRDEVLSTAPLHLKQFAYQQGKSTDSALQTLVKMIKDSFEKKEILLCNFVDIEGAFNKVSFESVQLELIERNVDEASIKWITSMLRCRSTISKIGSTETKVLSTKGFPQGGILSPLLWSLIADSFLKQMVQERAEVIGFADDFVVCIKGKFGSVVSDRMQQVNRSMETWCNSKGLNINASKTTLVAFTKQRLERTRLRSLRLFGELVAIVNEVKYLGLILDSKLTWNSHLDYVVQKATNSLWMCRSMIGNTWSPSPKMALWMYKAIVRPMISYGASVWWSKTLETTTQNKLNKLQRLAMLICTRSMRSTPTVALEKLVGLTPLHLWIQHEAMCAQYRFIVSDKPEINQLIDRALQRRWATKEILDISLSDSMTPRYVFNRNFNIDIIDRQRWVENDIVLPNDAIVWYTDGSKMQNGGCGAFEVSSNQRISTSLGKYVTVFQAEVYAIELAARTSLIKNYEGKQIFILSDSQAALRAFQSNSISSKLVSSCYDVLTSIAQDNTVSLMWVPGHQGVEGNEAADTLAREGALRSFIGPEPFCGIAISSIKTAIFEWLIDQASIYWNRQQIADHSRLFVPGLMNRRTRSLMNMSVRKVRVLVAFLTGHARVQKHLHRMGIRGSSICRICHEEEETAMHILCDCKGLASRRNTIFGCHLGLMQPTEFLDLDLDEIYRFLKGIRIVKEEYFLD